MSVSTVDALPAGPAAAAGGPRRVSGGLLDPQAAVAVHAGRAAQARPGTLWRNPVMFIVEIGSVFTTVLAIAQPDRVRLGRSRSGCG